MASCEKRALGIVAVFIALLPLAACAPTMTNGGGPTLTGSEGRVSISVTVQADAGLTLAERSALDLALYQMRSDDRSGQLIGHVYTSPAGPLPRTFDLAVQADALADASLFELRALLLQGEADVPTHSAAVAALTPLELRQPISVDLVPVPAE